MNVLKILKDIFWTQDIEYEESDFKNFDVSKRCEDCNRFDCCYFLHKEEND